MLVLGKMVKSCLFMIVILIAVFNEEFCHFKY